MKQLGRPTAWMRLGRSGCPASEETPKCLHLRSTHQGSGQSLQDQPLACYQGDASPVLAFPLALNATPTASVSC